MGLAGRRYLVFEVSAGFCGIGWSEAGVVRFALPAPDAHAAERSLLRRLPGVEPGPPTRTVVEAVSTARRYFQGLEVDFSDLRLDLDGLDEFVQQIYVATRKVGWGKTTTYGALAKALNAGPEAARDVGQAMAKNPIPLIIPCHRVLAAGGKVGGFSAPGGAATKIRMLEMEGVRVMPPPPAQQSFGF
jgi:methylated-DNA-[protein]-cysteine S-methyltransferase